MWKHFHNGSKYLPARAREVKRRITMDSYNEGFHDGLAAAVSLARAGCSGDDLSLLLDSDPARMDPRGYSDHLSELRAVLDMSGLFSGATP